MVAIDAAFRRLGFCRNKESAASRFRLPQIALKGRSSGVTCSSFRSLHVDTIPNAVRSTIDKIFGSAPAELANVQLPGPGSARQFEGFVYVDGQLDVSPTVPGSSSRKISRCF